MLEPAIVHEKELLELFAKEIYTSDYFYYVGYPHYFDLPKIKPMENVYQWAIVDKGRVIGYLAYEVDGLVDCASKFGLYSFDRGNPLIGYDLFKKMEELVARHHRVEWRVIQGNPVIRHYDKFCMRHHGNKVVLHDVTKGLGGEYLDEYCYEIIRND